MKYFLTTTAFIALLLTLSVGCKKKDDANPAPANTPPTHSTSTLDEKVEKKWLVSSDAPGARTSGSSSDYTSFEFTDKGTYYIIKTDKSFLKGDYTLHVGDSTITLDGFGIIYVDEITDADITFRLLLTGTVTPVTISAAPAAPVAGNSASAQQLTNKWSFKSRITDGVPDALVNEAFSTGGYYLYVDISEYGTYSIEANSPGVSDAVGIWKWCDTEKTIFSTSADSDVTPDCTPSSSSPVAFDPDGNLILTHVINGQTQTDTYVLAP